MKGQINDGSCFRDGTAYPRMQWSMFRARQMKQPGVFSRKGCEVFKNGKKVGFIAPESMPKEATHA